MSMDLYHEVISALAGLEQSEAILIILQKRFNHIAQYDINHKGLRFSTSLEDLLRWVREERSRRDQRT